MTKWTETGVNWVAGSAADAVTTATPLSFLKSGAAGLQGLTDNGISMMDLLVGNVGGCVGETCAVLLLLGGVYLIYKGIISYIMPIMLLSNNIYINFLIRWI